MAIGRCWPIFLAWPSGGDPLASIEEMASWTAGLAAELGLAQVILTGHSQGCLVALEAAGRMPDLQVGWRSIIAAALAIPVNEALIRQRVRTRNRPG